MSKSDKLESLYQSFKYKMDGCKLADDMVGFWGNMSICIRIQILKLNVDTKVWRSS